MTTDANTDVQLQTRVFISAARAIGGDPNRTFSPATSTLVVGDPDVVLIDAQYADSEVAALGDLIEQTGKRLTSIYITHGHCDHYYGLGQLVVRLPGPRQSRPLRWSLTSSPNAARFVYRTPAISINVISTRGICRVDEQPHP